MEMPLDCVCKTVENLDKSKKKFMRTVQSRAGEGIMRPSMHAA